MKKQPYKKLIQTWDNPKFITSYKKVVSQRKQIGLQNYIKDKIVKGWDLESDLAIEAYYGEPPPFYFNKSNYKEYVLTKPIPMEEQDGVETRFVISLPNLEALLSEEDIRKLFTFQDQFTKLQQF